MTPPDTLIDDLSAPHPRAVNGAAWEFVSDRVMGGISRGAMTREIVRDRPALRMRGQVSLENNGGFVQIALDLDPRGGTIDARTWAGIEMDITGNDKDYNLHLRTRDVTRPWQSYRASFRPVPEWQTIQLPFADFTAHRIDAALDLSQLRRIGIVAIGRAFDADIAIAGIRFFR
ncbi:CIA30 family protein [Roseinatronobacter sp.]|uniref:CIA30 family protein n=1 Tax=Roseinatronobacter sp. TaxID=1945755 RepID=UPI003F6F2262